MLKINLKYASNHSKRQHDFFQFYLRFCFNLGDLIHIKYERKYANNHSSRLKDFYLQLLFC